MPSTTPPSSRAFLALLPDLRRSARRLSRSAEDADDLVQEALLKVWARLAMGAQANTDAAPVTDLRAYAFATLRNCAKRRPSASRQAIPEEVDAIEAVPETAAAHLACSGVLAALDTLPPDQRSLLRLRGVEGLSYAEIARRTGLPMGTVTSRLSRGRTALRRAMGLPENAPVSDLFRGD